MVASQTHSGKGPLAAEQIALILVPTSWVDLVTSGVTYLTRSPIGEVFAHPPSVDFLRLLLAENLAVASAVGHDFGADRADAILAFFGTLPGSTKSSMLVDLEVGRPLEMPWLSGRMLSLARSFGQQAPTLTAVVAALAPARRGPRPGLFG